MTGYPRNLIDRHSTAAHNEALKARREGRPSPYDLPADLLKEIAANSLRK